MCYNELMKPITPTLLILLLSGCIVPDTIDISKLSPLHRVLFAGAAAVEDVETTTNGQPWHWIVEYDYNMAYAGFVDLDYGNMRKRISINPNHLSTCGTGSTDHYFYMVSLHEINHGLGYYEMRNGILYQHSSDPKNLMFKRTPCWPRN